MRLHFVFLITALAILASSCEQPCESSDCGDYGFCEDGVCECSFGYAWSEVESTCVIKCLVEGCPDNSYCNEPTGECLCNSWYFENNDGDCVAGNLKFDGVWTGTHSRNGVLEGPYSMTFTASSTNPETIAISNFLNLGCGATAFISETTGDVSSYFPNCPGFIIQTNFSNFAELNASGQMQFQVRILEIGVDTWVYSGTFNKH